MAKKNVAFYEGTLTCQTCHHEHDITPEGKMTLSKVTKGWECLACGSTTSTTAEGQIDEVEHYTDLVKRHL